ncbi:MAG: hypothetical protein LBH34_02675 [Prevotellaceae bacterium]|jgi:hypothetical protein|nr:hypothetical protein [Prevotellaceae bacterium]
MKRNVALMLCLAALITGCTSQQKKEKETNATGLSEEFWDDWKREEAKNCNVIGKGIVIRVGAGENFDKLINKKASEMLGYTDYCTIDYSVKVIVEETQGDWSKIKVVSPSHLSDSHIGWVPSNVIDCEEHDYSQKLDKSSYDIITTDHNNAVQNYYILIKEKFDQKSLTEFALRFKNEHCTRNCNINVYDDISVSDIVTKYPLTDKEYLKLADHFVGTMDFDSDYISYYPLQDIKYKELGGKNWKKDPIK